MRTLRTLLAVSSLACAVVAFAACGGDSNPNNPAKTGTDAGTDGSTPTTDGGNQTDGNSPGSDGSTPGSDGGSDGGCDFNAFVENLIANDTTASALPSTDLGQNCTDTQTAFPSTLFQ